MSYNPDKELEEFQAEYEDAVKKLMILMVLADGAVEESEVETIVAIHENITKNKLDKEKLIKEIEDYRIKKHDVLDFTSSLRGKLNDQGKEIIIKAAYLIAAADGEFHKLEQELLSKIAISLDFSEAHLNAVLDEITN